MLAFGDSSSPENGAASGVQSSLTPSSPSSSTASFFGSSGITSASSSSAMLSPVGSPEPDIISHVLSPLLSPFVSPTLSLDMIEPFLSPLPASPVTFALRTKTRTLSVARRNNSPSMARHRHSLSLPAAEIPSLLQLPLFSSQTSTPMPLAAALQQAMDDDEQSWFFSSHVNVHQDRPTKFQRCSDHGGKRETETQSEKGAEPFPLSPSRSRAATIPRDGWKNDSGLDLSPMQSEDNNIPVIYGFDSLNSLLENMQNLEVPGSLEEDDEIFDEDDAAEEEVPHHTFETFTKKKSIGKRLRERFTLRRNRVGAAETNLPGERTQLSS